MFPSAEYCVLWYAVLNICVVPLSLPNLGLPADDYAYYATRAVTNVVHCAAKVCLRN